MTSKLDSFKEKTFDQQKDILTNMLEPFKERSEVFARTLAKVEAATDSTILIPIMERMLQVSENVQAKKKEQNLDKMEASQERLKEIHEREIQETEYNLDEILDEELKNI